MEELSTTRYRSDTDSVSSLARWAVTYNPNDPNRIYTTSFYNEIETEFLCKEMWDNVTADFIARQRAGDVVMNDMMIEKNKILMEIPATASFGSYSRVVDISGLNASLAIDSGELFPTLSLINDTYLDSEYAKAVTKLYSKISKSQADILVSIGELHKSIGTLNRAIRSVLWLLKKALKARVAFQRKFISLAQLADVYLECRYGLRPLVYEIKGAIEAIDAYGKNERARLVVNSSISGTPTTGSVGLNYTRSIPLLTSGKLYTMYGYEDTPEALITCGAVLQFENPCANVVDVLGFDEVLEALLELTPFSFIANWFFNLTEYVSSWTPDIGIEVLGTYGTVREVTRRKLVLNYAKVADEYSALDHETNLNGGITWTETSRVRRYANPVKPKLPRVRINLDGLKVLDLIAIFGGLATDLRRWKI